MTMNYTSCINLQDNKQFEDHIFPLSKDLSIVSRPSIDIQEVLTPWKKLLYITAWVVYTFVPIMIFGTGIFALKQFFKRIYPKIDGIRVLTNTWLIDGFEVENNNGVYNFVSRIYLEDRVFPLRRSQTPILIAPLYNIALKLTHNRRKSHFRERDSYIDKKLNNTYGSYTKGLTHRTNEILAVFSSISPFYIFQTGFRIKNTYEIKGLFVELKSKCNDPFREFYILNRIVSDYIEANEEYIYLVDSKYEMIMVKNKSEDRDASKYVTFENIPSNDIIGVIRESLNSLIREFTKNINYGSLSFTE